MRKASGYKAALLKELLEMFEGCETGA
jgi:hypothetical protein